MRPLNLYLLLWYGLLTRPHKTVLFCLHLPHRLCFREYGVGCLYYPNETYILPVATIRPNPYIVITRCVLFHLRWFFRLLLKIPVHWCVPLLLHILPTT